MKQPLTLSPAQRQAARSIVSAAVSVVHTYPAHIRATARRIELHTLFSLIRYRTTLWCLSDALDSLARDYRREP